MQDLRVVYFYLERTTKSGENITAENIENLEEQLPYI